MRIWLTLLCVLLFTATAQAEKGPDQRPFLRIEAGMHTAQIMRIGLSADGALLATGSYDKTVRLWTLPEGRLIRTLRLPIDAGNGGKVYAVAMSPDGKAVAVGGWDATADVTRKVYVYLFDSVTGALARRLGPLPGTVHHLRFSPDGRRLLAGLHGNIGIRLWSAETGKLLGQDTDYGQTVYGADFAANGQLAVSSLDGHVRLYDAGLKRLKRVKAPGGEQPFAVALAPQGDRLAVAYHGITRVDVLSAVSLEFLYAADTTGLDNGDLVSVAWSADGNWLFAAGTQYDSNFMRPVFAWDELGKGRRRSWPGPFNLVTDLLPLMDGGVAYGAHGPAFGLNDHTGTKRLAKGLVTANMLGKLRHDFILSADARQVRFGLGYGGWEPWLFDLAALDFVASPVAPASLREANIASLPVTNWEDNNTPKLGNTALKLEPYERSQSLAMLPDKNGFLLGTNFSLRRFNAKGREQWNRAVPGTVWGVNLSADGRVAVLAHDDGTIRWHRTKDGSELLTLFVHVPDKRWVLWTPSGYYAASPGGEDLIGWHLNGKTLGDPVDFFPASRFRDRFYRPDIVKLVLDTLDEAAAVKKANEASGRKAEKPFSRKILPPVVSISADPRGLEASEAALDLDYLLRAPSGREVTKIEVRVDGRLFATETGQALLKPSGKTTRSLKVPLPRRDAEVSLVAFHGDQAGVPASIRVRYTGEPAPTAKTTLRALLVGVSDYRNTDLTLQYADNDASDLARVLKEQEGKFFKLVETTVLLDKDATAANIERALAELVAKTGPDDYAVVFLAGHGVTDKNRFYFVSTDAKVEDGKLADTSTAVPEAAILKALSGMRGRVLFFIDACFSAEVMKVDSTGFVNAITSEENAVMMYSSSQGDQESFEDPEWGNGAFTEALMQIFADPKSYDAQGEIKTDELAVKLKDRVQAITRGRQTPVGQSSRAIQPFPVMGL